MRKQGSQNNTTLARQREIIDAALACFTDLGYNETTINAICRRARASTGSVYHHFKSKDQLAGAVYIEGIRDYQNGFIRILEKESDARKGIQSVITYHLTWVRDHPDWSRYLFQMRHADFMGENEDSFYQLNKEFFTRVYRWVEEFMNSGKLKTMPGDIFIFLLLGPCQEFTRQYINGSTRTGIDDAIPLLSEAAWNALGV